MSIRSLSPARSLAVVLAASALAVTAALPAQAATAGAQPQASVSQAGRVPAPFHAAVVRAAADGPSRTTGAAAHGLRADGVRPIGSGVSTDLPTRIELGSPLLTTNYTIDVPTGNLGNPAIEIALADAHGNLVFETYVNGQAHQSSYSGTVSVPLQAVTTLGAAQWLVAYGPSDGDLGTVRIARLGTTVKFRSLLGESVTRSGADVHVFGSAKAFSPESYTFLPRTGDTVALQRWSSTGWITVRNLRTDSRGHVDTTVRIPWRVGLRLTDNDDADTFGASTAGSVV